MPRPPALLAALAALVMTVASCALRPVKEVQSSPDEEPSTLAFSDETTGGPTQAGSASESAVPGEPGPRSTDAAMLQSRDPGPWTVATGEARIGVHSAPDYAFTRLGILEPGSSVITTGRRVATNTINWMEIRWGDETGWVVEAAFAPLD